MSPIESLEAIVGPGALRLDADSLASYGLDWTRYFSPNPQAIVFPKTTAQVQDIVRWAREHQTALVPSGGRTGLSGGSVARKGEVVVSFDRMNRIGVFDAASRLVEVEAGVITETLQHFAAEQGLAYPVDFASRGSSQIGGNIATNAGGIKVLRYGMTRDWVAGLEVVTGAGERLELNRGLVKNATGYDLRHLFIGSEGTLGFITRALMRLSDRPPPSSVVVLALSGLEAIMPVFHAFRAECTLAAFEMFSERCLALVEAKGVPVPFAERSPYYVLAEVEVDGGEGGGIEAVFERCMSEGHVVDGVISQSESQARELWRLREDISEAATPHTPYKNDIAVTIAQVPRCIELLDDALCSHYPEFDVLWFGHIGDGNLHINVLKPPALAKEDFYASCQRVDEWVFDVVERLGGSISAEHGVGIIKKRFLHKSRSSEEIALMRQMKAVFDPDGILNPGKIFD